MNQHVIYAEPFEMTYVSIHGVFSYDEIVAIKREMEERQNEENQKSAPPSDRRVDSAR